MPDMDEAAIIRKMIGLMLVELQAMSLIALLYADTAQEGLAALLATVALMAIMVWCLHRWGIPQKLDASDEKKTRRPSRQAGA